MKVKHFKTRLFFNKQKVKHKKQVSRDFRASDIFDYNKPKTHKTIYLILGSLISPLLELFYKFKITGLENVPRRNMILVHNHLSHLDSIVIAKAVFPFHVLHFIADEKLFRNPIIRWFLFHGNAFPVRKKAKQIQAVNYGIKLVKSGKTMLWSPEGQRHKQPWKKQLNPGKIGTGWLIYKTRVPVIPVFLEGTEKAWPVYKPPTIHGRPRRITIKIIFGKPIDFHEHYAMPENKETMQRIVDTVMTSLEALRPK